jgi:hypothetical protein
MSHYLKECLCCQGKNLTNILSLNSQPLANSYVPVGEKLEVYPLAVNICDNCYHMQLSFIVDPDLMFKNFISIPN